MLLYIMPACFMLYAAFFNAVRLHSAVSLPFTFAIAFSFHGFSGLLTHSLSISNIIFPSWTVLLSAGFPNFMFTLLFI